MDYSNRLLGGILLVAGTTIGAGMLALPIVTGLAGFIPSVVLLTLFWLYMLLTALLLLEANLWMDEHTNLITMARKTLGRGGAFLSWGIYLFLLYTLTTAYMAGSGPIFLDFIFLLTGWQAPSWVGPLPLLLIFGFFVYRGTRSVDYVNRLLMIGLAFTYVLMIIFLSCYVQVEQLKWMNGAALAAAVPIVSTSFGFHIIIPTLTDYLKRDIQKLKQTIIIGSFIPLVVYMSWEFLTLGIIPLFGEQGLIAGYQKGIDGASLLSDYLHYSKLSLAANFFSLFAIITSFLGVSLSLSDFLADGLAIPKTDKGRLLLYILTFMPPLLFTLTDPRAFLNALEYAGVFGVVILLGLFPALIVWSGRYRQHRKSTFKVPGGKLVLALIVTLSICVIALETAHQAGWLTDYIPTKEELKP